MLVLSVSSFPQMEEGIWELSGPYKHNHPDTNSILPLSEIPGTFNS